MSLKPNFNIVFKQNESSVVIAENLSCIEDAVTFALNLHKASNTEHMIYVIQDDMIHITFSLCGVHSK